MSVTKVLGGCVIEMWLNVHQDSDSNLISVWDDVHQDSDSDIWCLCEMMIEFLCLAGDVGWIVWILVSTTWQVLIKLMMVKIPITEADAIRALSCKVSI